MEEKKDFEKSTPSRGQINKIYTEKAREQEQKLLEQTRKDKMMAEKQKTVKKGRFFAFFHIFVKSDKFVELFYVSSRSNMFVEFFPLSSRSNIFVEFALFFLNVGGGEFEDFITFYDSKFFRLFHFVNFAGRFAFFKTQFHRLVFYGGHGVNDWLPLNFLFEN